ncbi:MAG: XRE family transcriptional regulator [Eubacterium sp.]|nr:XRE family transcriptional regulator [Eubacterium sp.]
MKIKEAVKLRIIELCNENNITLNSLSYISGMSPTTVYNIVSDKNKNPGVVSLKKSL